MPFLRDLFHTIRLVANLPFSSYRGLRATSHAITGTFELLDSIGDGSIFSKVMQALRSPFTSWTHGAHASETHTPVAPPPSFTTPMPAQTALPSVPQHELLPLIYELLCEQLADLVDCTSDLLAVLLWLGVFWVVFCRGYVLRTVYFFAPGWIRFFLPQPGEQWPIIPSFIGNWLRFLEGRPTVPEPAHYQPVVAEDEFQTPEPVLAHASPAPSAFVQPVYPFAAPFVLDKAKTAFTGTNFDEKFEDYLDEIEDFIRYYPEKYHSEERKISLFCSNLRGTAKRVVRSEQNGSVQGEWPFQTYNEAVDLMRTTFGSKNQLNLDMDRLLLIKNDATVNKYVAELNVQFAKVTPVNFREFFRKYLFLKNLKEKVLVEILKTPDYMSVPYDHLTERAIALDNALPDSLASKSSSYSTKKPSGSPSNNNSAASSKPSLPLGPNKKLTPEEMDRRRVNKLC
ncbi:hypothetical protein BT69DRAFT_1347836, partial [Atractiella rhizophila]